MKPQPASPRRTRSPFASPIVSVPLVLVALAAGGWGFVAWRRATADAEVRSKLLAEIDVATRRQPPDGSELSQLTARLHKLEDHDRAEDLLYGAARIELARDRPERAHELFGTIASRPGAAARDQGLGARILLRLQEADPAAPGAAAGMLRQVADMAEASYRESNDPADLLRAWQAAQRANLSERAAAAAAQLQSGHAGTPEAGFVQFALEFRPEAGAAAVDRAVAGLEPPPVEAAALRAQAQLFAKDLPGAVATAEAALARAPGVGVVRYVAAVVFHACVVGTDVGSPERPSAERAAWVARRDAQTAWVLRQEPRNEAWAAGCAEMAKVR